MLLPGPIDFVLHLNKHLPELIAQYGTTIYAIVGVTIFCETGLVVTPFLPGDSLLFAVGTFTAGAKPPLNVWALLAVVFVTAVAGDSVNYAIGKSFGHAMVKSGKFIKKEHVEKTHAFYEKYGTKTIVLARFVPIVRTLAPFVAGIGEMTYGTFMTYNVIGAAAWAAICLFSGHMLAENAWVAGHFEIVVLAIVFVSVLPMIVTWFTSRGEAAKAAKK
jgi:membrane-associated protein